MLKMQIEMQQTVQTHLYNLVFHSCTYFRGRFALNQSSCFSLLFQKSVLAENNVTSGTSETKIRSHSKRVR